MLKREKISLNVISKNAAQELIRNALSRNINVTKVFVDTVGPADKYQAELERRFPKIKFTVTPKADSLYPTVSAASIVAKVIRDFHVNNWSFDETKGHEIFDNNFGCGYPGDPITKKWLRNNMDLVFGFPSIVRFSWSTTYKLLKSEAKSVEYENYVEEEEESYKKKTSFQEKNKEINNTTINFESNQKFNYMEQKSLKLHDFKFN
jgi:ribonuclease H2 subunit A